MATINLILPEKKPKEYTLKISNKLKKIAVPLMTVFIVLLTISYAAIFVFNKRTQVSIQKQEEYKAQIKKMESTEQRLVLLKDRLGKIGGLMSQPNANQEVSFLENINRLVNQDIINMPTLEVSASQNQVTASAQNLSDFNGLVNTLLASGDFANITLLSFNYQPQDGYKAVFSFTK